MVNNSIIIQTNNRISSILTEHRKDHNIDLGLGQAQKYDGVKPINGISTFLSR
jgi:hypothetical protein